MNHVYAGRKPALLISILLCFSTIALANTYTVINTNPAGPGSLDQAIIDANTNPGPDIINFNIPGSGPFVIAPFFPGLTPITDAVTINGYSQPGAAQGTMVTRVIPIVVTGVAANFSSGFTIRANDVTISGLVINAFLAHGIDIQNSADNIFIWGNFIGSDITGMAAQGNSIDGINIGETVGGSDAVTIGTNSDGTADANEGNLISANGRDAILGWTITNSVIAGNFIGSDRIGQGSALGNGRNGILLTVNSNNNRIGTDGNGINDVQEPNGIILNGARGIYLAALSNNNVVAGNSIGVSTFPAAAGNLSGIEILNSSNNRIGVDASHVGFAFEANVISANQDNGILLTAHNFGPGFDANTSGNTISGNYIGTTPPSPPAPPPGSLVLGNGGNGISFSAADGWLVTDNVIGSNNDGVGDNVEGNVIANNTFSGIALDPTPDINGNIFSRNSIHNNTALGIDLGGDGVTANDDGDGDTGPNELYNFPVITSTANNGTNLRVTGISGASSIIEVYVDDGSGEGATFLFRAQEGGTLNGITDNLTGTNSYSDPTYGTFTDQNFEFLVPLSSLAASPPAGARLVAIAIKPAAGDNSTSEFGPSAIVLPVTLTNFKGNLADGVVRLTWATSSEINSSHFVIEKSLDGVAYSSIGQVKSGNIAGRPYSFTDNTALGKTNYYRLKQVDLDGKFIYSRVLLIHNDGATTIIKISPNPVSSYLNVSFKLEKAEAVKISLFDQMGRLTKRYSLQGSRGINAFTISDLGNLPAGNYVVELVGESISGKQQVIKK